MNKEIKIKRIANGYIVEVSTLAGLLQGIGNNTADMTFVPNLDELDLLIRKIYNEPNKSLEKESA